MRLSSLDIIIIILQAADEGAKKTHIMHQCNLSSKRLHAYLDLLVDMGFLESVGKYSDSYMTTEKGLAFLKAYQRIMVQLNTRE